MNALFQGNYDHLVKIIIKHSMLNFSEVVLLSSYFKNLIYNDTKLWLTLLDRNPNLLDKLDSFGGFFQAPYKIITETLNQKVKQNLKYTFRNGYVLRRIIFCDDLELLKKFLTLHFECPREKYARDDQEFLLNIWSDRDPNQNRQLKTKRGRAPRIAKYFFESGRVLNLYHNFKSYFLHQCQSGDVKFALEHGMDLFNVEYFMTFKKKYLKNKAEFEEDFAKLLYMYDWETKAAPITNQKFKRDFLNGLKNSKNFFFEKDNKSNILQE